MTIRQGATLSLGVEMFIGHFGVAFAGKAVAPRASLGALFLAAQFIDLLWPVLLLLGVERVRIVPGATAVMPLEFVHYPFSHSLAAALLWSVLIGMVYQRLTRYWRGAVVLGLAVISHWFLDALVHLPDLPLYPGSEALVGMGLWSSLGGTLGTEPAIFGTGLWLYLRSTHSRDEIGAVGLAVFTLFLLTIYAANLYGPPPPSVQALAWEGQAQWLLVLGGGWIDRHRRIEVRQV